MVFAEACCDNAMRTTLEKMKEKGATNDTVVLPYIVTTTTKKKPNFHINNDKTATIST
jgi:hypothetical protein